MPTDSFADCVAAAKVAVREFNARWNMNVLQVKPVPVRYLFSTEELEPLERSPAWYSAAEAFAAIRATQPSTVDLARAGRQLTTLYTRVKVSPGPRSFYWIAPHGVEPTATERAKLSAHAARSFAASELTKP